MIYAAFGSGFQEWINTTTAGGRLVFHLFGALSGFKRNLIRERTCAGLASIVFKITKQGLTLAPFSPKGVYDLVVGPVSGFWRQKVALYCCDQLSFHTKDAENVLNRCPRYEYEVIP